MTNQMGLNFQECIAFCDDRSWVWKFIDETLTRRRVDFVRLPSSTIVRQSWHRFQNSPRVIVHWEGRHRNGGAIIEEILAADPKFDVGERIIVVTTNPTREDIVYCSELGLRRIIRLRNRDKEMQQAIRELEIHVQSSGVPSKTELAWQKIIRAIDVLAEDCGESDLAKIEHAVEKLHQMEVGTTARYIDIKASLALYRGNTQEAEKLWRIAIEKNSNYFRSYNHLIKLLKETHRLKESYSLMKKMHLLNRSNISRLNDMAEIHVKMGQDHRAEHYYSTALERDSYSNRALNGLAGIKFRSGDLENSRRLLSRSSEAFQLARELNEAGIVLVKKKRYKEALELYTKAQYVIPAQEKGPMLYYNIGLCYSRWNKPNLAKEFLKLALIKEPNYVKARRLLKQINEVGSSNL